MKTERERCMFRFFVIHERYPMLSWECGRSARLDVGMKRLPTSLYVFIITSQTSNCTVITMQHAAFSPIRTRTVNMALN